METKKELTDEEVQVVIDKEMFEELESIQLDLARGKNQIRDRMRIAKEKREVIFDRITDIDAEIDFINISIHTLDKYANINADYLEEERIKLEKEKEDISKRLMHIDIVYNVLESRYDELDKSYLKAQEQRDELAAKIIKENNNKRTPRRSRKRILSTDMILLSGLDIFLLYFASRMLVLEPLSQIYSGLLIIGYTLLVYIYFHPKKKFFKRKYRRTRR